MKKIVSCEVLKYEDPSFYLCINKSALKKIHMCNHQRFKTFFMCNSMFNILSANPFGENTSGWITAQATLFASFFPTQDLSSISLNVMKWGFLSKSVICLMASCTQTDVKHFNLDAVGWNSIERPKTHMSTRMEFLS